MLRRVPLFLISISLVGLAACGGSGTTTAVNNNPAPTVTSITPSSASVGAAAFALTVNGSGYIASSQVQWNGSNRTTTFVSATQVTASISAADVAAAGTASVTVSNPAPGGGTSSAATFHINSNPAPTVTSIAPTSGLTTGGSAVTITGTGFLTGATVTLGGTGATSVVVVSSTSITAQTPAHAAGPVSVAVTNTDSQSGTLTNGYTYTNPAPTISAVSPTSGSTLGGTVVTITGTGFLTGATVTMGGIAATNVVVVSGTSITAKTPADNAGLVNVVVTNTDSQSATLSNAFNYSATAPTVDSISPTSGLITGGTAVTVTGTSFVSGATLTLGGLAATNVVVVSSTTITANTPAHAAGAVDVVVTNPDTQSAALPSGYTYTNPAPTVTSISPTSGSTAGGTPVTIGGTGFLPGASVTLGGTAATSVVIVNSTTITATTPAHAAGAVSVVVTNTDTQSGTLSNAFTYVTVSTVTSISPTSIGAGTPSFQVTVNGSGFSNGGSTVDFNGVGLTTTFVSTTQLTAIVPHADIATAGSASITVSGATGTQTLTIKSAVSISVDSFSISGLSAPTRLVFAPDGALLIGEQQVLNGSTVDGVIKRATISGGVATVSTWATFPVYGNSIYLGLLGIAPDPANPPTASGGSIYIFYTAVAGDNRIAKVAFGGTVTDKVTGLPVAQTPDQLWLNGGKIAVPTDPVSGKTYVFASVGGSDANPSWSQNTTESTTGWLNGKILRYNTDFTIPSDNPFGSTNPIYACGFRNSFGFDFHPTSGALYASDNGNESFGSTFTWYDALDRVAKGDAEGFGYTSGEHCQSSLTNPLWGGTSDVAPSEIAPTVAIFYTGSTFPQLQNTVLITGDNIADIYKYPVDEYGSPAGSLLASPSSIITFSDFGFTDLAQGPDGCIYAASPGNNAVFRLTASPNTCK